MKKLLLCSAAALGVALSAAPAAAQIDVTVGGHSKNYMGWADQDDVAGSETNNFDILRESELHFNAEGTADNGLVYGFHVETEVDGGDAFAVEESYLYLSSNLGRVNIGSEDGANYLLQVAAPSADANIDGIRQYIQPVNYANAFGAGAPGLAAAAAIQANALDYANDATGTAEKITYLSPVFSGFQVGGSYTPEVTDGNGVGVAGFSSDNVGLGDAWEGAARYEGVFNNVGFAVGGGYTQVNNEGIAVGSTEDIKQWNTGVDLDIGAFGIGAVYTQTDNIAGVNDVDGDTWVVGADYTTGPFQFGVSYLNNNIDAAGGGDIDTDRYTGGVVYTAAPGLTFRGSVSHIEHDTPTGVEDPEATSVLGGIQFNF